MTVFSELRMRPAPAVQAGWDASTTARLVISGAVIFVLLVGANLATPLYPLLQAQLGLSPLDVTAAFASYVLALVATLMLAGHWSDHIGRRAALLLAAVTGLAGGWVFAGAQTLPVLCAGRALQGVAVALATGASAAALRELLPSRPEWASRFTLLASSGGVAAGPVLGGLFSLLPGATTAPYAVYSLILAALLVPLYLVRARPALAVPASSRPMLALAPRRLSVTRNARGAFWLAAGVGFLSFAVFGFSLSLAPGYFAPILGTDSRPLVGLLAGLPLAASAASQLTALQGRYTVPAGLAVMGGGVFLLGAAGLWQNPWLLVVGAAAAGSGQGLAFRTVFNEVAARVEPARHAQVVSTVYVITYLGSAVPVLGLGWATGVFGQAAAVAGFVLACGTAALVLSALTLHRTRCRR
jgi:MFS family permease